MTNRMFAGMPPRITFTHDFHELLNGDLRAGTQLKIRYDPLRIVPKGEPYLFGDPNKPIIAHAAFRKEGVPFSKPLISQGGVLEHPVIDVTGGGSMLTTTFDVPEDAEAVILWFTYASPESGTHFDSENGKNFWFPFVAEHIRVVTGDVVTDRQARRSEFTLMTAAIPAVERVTVRVHPTDGAPIIPDPELGKTGETADDGWPLWSVRAAVPFEAIIRYKVFYWLKGIQYKDDNSGRYYLAPEPPAEKAPPLPKELVEAAQKWKV